MQYPNRTIKEGESDKTIVSAIQNRLMELGFGSFEGTGIFGSKTKSVVKQFQATHRDDLGNALEVDGKVGAITWAVLFGTASVPSTNNAPNSMLTETLRIARSQVGVMEEPPGSNRGVMVNQYLHSVDCPPGLYWCAGFVYWCFESAAKNLHRENPLYKTGGCLMHWNKSSGTKIKGAEAAANPSLVRPGQIFIIDHGRGMGHTGIIEKVEGGFIHTIEGNSNPTGSSNGIGVFQLLRKIVKINRGFIEYN